MRTTTRLITIVAASAMSAHADPQLTSWLTAYSSKYARICKTDDERKDGATHATYTTWTNGSQTQAAPAYCGVQSITYSASWVYFNTTDLGPYLMGPWYNTAARTTAFVNMPKNQNVSYRIPRSSTLTTPPTTKTVTMGGEDAIGYFVDGVALFDPTDAFSYANGAEASPGTGQWHRDAIVNEGITMDPNNTHQQNTGKYHNHGNPLGLRYLLGDHVQLKTNANNQPDGTNTFQEMSGVSDHHSPILGWMRDGLPIYGPYGYSDPSVNSTDMTIRRMVSGFVKRDGTTTNVDNINFTNAARALPAWALRNNNNTVQAGPAVSTTYPFGRYIEDWAYLGDFLSPYDRNGDGQPDPYTQGIDFDLNEYNVRYCRTPEFPNGTWAYFLCINSSGTPVFPYNSNRYFFGNPTGGTSTAAETVTTYFTGGPNLTETGIAPTVNKANGNVTFQWNSVEGGTYQVEASDTVSNWTVLSTTQAAASDAVVTSYVETGAANLHSTRTYRVKKLSLATYDSTGTTTGGGGGTQGISTVTPNSGTHGTSATLTITLNPASNPAPPMNSAPVSNVTLTLGGNTFTANTKSRNTTTGVVTATFNSLPATPGDYTVNAIFGQNTWSLTGGFHVN